MTIEADLLAVGRMADRALPQRERLVHDREREVGDQLGVALQAAEVPSYESCLFRSAGDDEIGRGDATTRAGAEAGE